MTARNHRRLDKSPLPSACGRKRHPLFLMISVLISFSAATAVCFAPILILRKPLSIGNGISLRVVAWIQMLHMLLLWSAAWYLALFRRLLLPIRSALSMSPASIIISGSYQERAPTIHQFHPHRHLFASFSCSSGKSSLLHQSSSISPEAPQEVAHVMESFQKALRGRFQTIEKNLRVKRIHHESISLESSLNLSQVSPLIWRQFCYHCKDTSVFIAGLLSYWQELLDIFMLPDKVVLDLYYNNKKLIAVQLTMPQHGNHTLHWCMYFSTYKASQSDALWSNGDLLAKTRCAYLHTPATAIMSATANAPMIEKSATESDFRSRHNVPRVYGGPLQHNTSSSSPRGTPAVASDNNSVATWPPPQVKRRNRRHRKFTY